ncbi:MAG: MmcQ/YjbR family DNA-binding protein [Bacteroidetes bacterium]|nr:MmcQ/YjbR family DNA-binding protein [Bacteroidota bacterium]
MTYAEIEAYSLTKPESELCFPFDWETPVIKVCGKMFFLGIPKEQIPRVNLKGVPEENSVLRAMFKSIIPGYHMNKEHWNTLYLDGSVPDEIQKQMVDESYQLVVQGLTKVQRDKLAAAK